MYIYIYIYTHTHCQLASAELCSTLHGKEIIEILLFNYINDLQTMRSIYSSKVIRKINRKKEYFDMKGKKGNLKSVVVGPEKDFVAE